MPAVITVLFDTYAEYMYPVAYRQLVQECNLNGLNTRISPDLRGIAILYCGKQK